MQEQKVWSARGEAGAAARRGRRCAHSMASRLRPGRGHTPGWDWGREREGESASYPELNIAAEYRKRMAFSITIGEAALMKCAYIKRLHLGDCGT